MRKGSVRVKTLPNAWNSTLYALLCALPLSILGLHSMAADPWICDGGWRLPRKIAVVETLCIGAVLEHNHVFCDSV